MRVLIVSVYPYPYIGGVSTYINELSRLLALEGDDVDLVALHPRKDSFYSPITRFRYPIPWRDLAKDPGHPSLDYSAALSEILGVWKAPYDVIHAMDPYSAVAAHLGTNAPLVMTLHGRLVSETSTGIQGWQRRTVERLALLAADRTILASEWLRGEVSEFVPPRERWRLTIVANGMDIARFDKRMSHSEPIRPQKRRWTLVCVGRLVRPKGQYTLLRAVKWLRRQGVPAELWLVGDGPARRPMKASARRLGLGRTVRFVGEQENVTPWLAAADVVVVPTLYDNQPYAVVEGQLAGKPVVATKVGGLWEMIVHGETGLLTAPSDVKGLGEALKSLYKRPDLAIKLAAGGRRFAAERWSGERWIRETKAVYEKAIQCARRPNHPSGPKPPSDHEKSQSMPRR